MLDFTNPNLYTVYRNRDFAASVPVDVSIDLETDVVLALGSSLSNGDAVRLKPNRFGEPIPSNLDRYTTYYVINADNSGGRFQLAASPGGEPLDLLSDSLDGMLSAMLNPFVDFTHDQDAQDWRTFAERTVEEARQLGKPVVGWLSPSIQGRGTEFVDGDYFAWQLDVIAPLVDGIAIYNPRLRTDAETTEDQGWWQALAAFMESQQADQTEAPAVPESFELNIVPPSTSSESQVPNTDISSLVDIDAARALARLRRAAGPG